MKHVQALAMHEMSGLSSISRAHLFGGLYVIGFANGISERVAKSIADYGAVTAFLNTFGVSAMVWAAGAAVLWLMSQAEPKQARVLDYIWLALAAVAFLLPVPAASWLAITGFSAYLVYSSDKSDPMRRAAILMLATTIPMLWTRLLFASFSNTILGIDAQLVGLLVGTQAVGNTIPFIDGTGVLFLEPACSSLTNVSLALLCGVLFMAVFDQHWSLRIFKVVLAACLATVLINVFRMSTIAVFPTHYDLIHGRFGAGLAEWATILAVMTIYAKGIVPRAAARA